MRVFCFGDSHKSISYLRDMAQKANEFGCDVMFSMGDFGYWPRIPTGVAFLESATRLANKYNMPIFFLDGNHEDFKMLEDVHGALTFTDRFHEVRPRVFYSPRGHTFEWDGVRFMTMGGAYSVDRSNNVLGEGWFLEEEITLPQARRAQNAGKIDILLCHDAPDIVDLRTHMSRYVTMESAKMNRRLLGDIVRSTRPQLVIHGHHHLSYRDRIDDTQVIGLAANYDYRTLNDCFWIVDTKDFK